MARTKESGHRLVNFNDLGIIRELVHNRSFRDTQNLFWAEGLRPFFQAVYAHANPVRPRHINLYALESGRQVRKVVYCPEFLRNRRARELLDKLPKLRINPTQFRSLSNVEEPQGIGLVVEQRWDRLIDTHPRPEDVWVALDDARTPGNIGTILRTCTAAGARGLMLIGGHADPHEYTAVRASMGAIFYQRLIRTSSKALAGWLNRRQCTVIGATPNGSLHYRRADYSGALLILMGAERAGLRPTQRALCSQLVHIPMQSNVESLNIAVATGLVLYEALEHRAGLTA